MCTRFDEAYSECEKILIMRPMKTEAIEMKVRKDMLILKHPYQVVLV